MSIRRNWQPVAFLLATATWFCMLGSVQAEQSRLATYDQADGSTVFALSVSPKIDQLVLSPRSIVVLIDTSASQTGPYRSDSLSSLVALLNGLKSTDQVQIMAADLKAVPMMAELSPARSESSRKAFGKLRARAPLGSTDMYEILSSARTALKDTPQTARRIVYIGDGISNAGNLNNERFEKLMRQLVKDRISVSSLAIGPKCNVELLSTIANHTGGNVIVDTEKTSAQQTGTALAKATRGVVVWPNSVTMPEGIVDSFPATFPPLRADRDSIVVGALKRTANMKLTVDAIVEGDREQFDWTLNA
ncbi:MAG: VWA domain-containing protein, partial [Planctomycetota bacterium]